MCKNVQKLERKGEGRNCTSGGGMQISVAPDEVIKLYGTREPSEILSHFYTLNREGFPTISNSHALNSQVFYD